MEAKEILLKKIETVKNVEGDQNLLKNIQGGQNFQKPGEIPWKSEGATRNLSAATGDPASALDKSERAFSRLAVLVITVRRTIRGSQKEMEDSTTNYLARSLHPLIR